MLISNNINCNIDKYEWYKNWYIDPSTKPREKYGNADLSDWQVYQLDVYTEKFTEKQFEKYVKEEIIRKTPNDTNVVNQNGTWLGSLLNYRKSQIPKHYCESYNTKIKLIGDDVYIKLSEEYHRNALEDIIDKIPKKTIKTYGRNKRTNYYKVKKLKNVNTNKSKILILSIDINGLVNKRLQLEAAIIDMRPDIIFLQETKRYKDSAVLKWNGYEIIEKHASDEIAKNGMIIAIRTELKNNTIIENINDFYIKISMLGESKEKITIINIYVPCNTENRTLMLKQVQKELKNTPNVVMIGDFNTDKKEMIDILNKEGIKHSTIQTFHKGSRMTNYTETDRLIDFTLTSNRELIEKEQYITDLFLSDHYAIKTEINWKTMNKKPSDKLIVDRTTLKYDIHLRNELRIMKYEMLNNTSMSTQDQFTSFYQNIQDFLKTRNVIKKAVSVQSIRRNPEIEKLIKKRKETFSLTEVKKLSIEIEKECRKVREQSYNDWIKKGCKMLSENNPREAWKWIKRQSKLNQQSTSESPIKDPLSGEQITDPIKKAQTMANHLAKLAEKEKKHEEMCIIKTDNNKVRIINELSTIEPVVGKNEISMDEQSDIKNKSDAQIEWEEIRTIMKKCRNNKAASKDLLLW